MTPYAILFIFGGYMEKYNMIEIWKMKLRELYLQEELMKKDNKFTKEELHDLRVIIEYVRNELKKEMYKEKVNGKSR